MSQLFKTGILYTVAGASGGQGLSLGTIPNHKAVLFIAGSANLGVTGSLYLGFSGLTSSTGDSGNTLQTSAFQILTLANTSALYPIRFSNISAMGGTGGSIQLLN